MANEGQKDNKENLRADQQQDSVNDDEEKSPSSFSSSSYGRLSVEDVNEQDKAATQKKDEQIKEEEEQKQQQSDPETRDEQEEGSSSSGEQSSSSYHASSYQHDSEEAEEEEEKHADQSEEEKEEGLGTFLEEFFEAFFGNFFGGRQDEKEDLGYVDEDNQQKEEDEVELKGGLDEPVADEQAPLKEEEETPPNNEHQDKGEELALDTNEVAEIPMDSVRRGLPPVLAPIGLTGEGFDSLRGLIGGVLIRAPTAPMMPETTRTTITPQVILIHWILMATAYALRTACLTTMNIGRATEGSLLV